MPDVHFGAGCTLGTTMTISDKIVPNLIGFDIGCGMETMVIPKGDKVFRDFDPAKLDNLIHQKIPCGRDIRKDIHKYVKSVPLDQIRRPGINLNYTFL
jgi:RNA-splicing ligase RtcB